MWGGCEVREEGEEGRVFGVSGGGLSVEWRSEKGGFGGGEYENVGGMGGEKKEKEWGW